MENTIYPPIHRRLAYVGPRVIKNNYLEFDLTVYKEYIQMYTFKNHVISKNIAYPLHLKLAVYCFYIHRAFPICTNDYIRDEYDKIKIIAKANDVSEMFMNRLSGKMFLILHYCLNSNLLWSHQAEVAT